jgi:hypothetical protein
VFGRLVPVGLLLVFAGLVWWHGIIPYPDARYAYADHYRYIAMAQQPFGSTNPLTREAPFIWRILVPLLVFVLHAGTGLPILSGFQLITLLSLVGATLGIQWLLSGMHLSEGTVIAGTLAFVALGPAVAFNLWMPYLVDPLALAIMIWVVALAVHRVWWPLPLLAIVGALTKETTVLVFPCVLALAWSWRDKNGMWWSGGSLVGSVLGTFLLHLLLPSRGGWTLAMTFWVGLGGWPTSHLPFPLPVMVVLLLIFRMLGATVGAWLLLLPLALVPLLWVRTPWRARAAWILLGIVAPAQIFVNTDSDRHAILAAPAFLLAACIGVERLAALWHCSRWAIWGPVLAIQGFWSLGYAGWAGQSIGVLPLFGSLGYDRQLLTAGVLFVSAVVIGARVYAGSSRTRLLYQKA